MRFNFLLYVFIRRSGFEPVFITSSPEFKNTYSDSDTVSRLKNRLGNAGKRTITFTNINASYLKADYSIYNTFVRKWYGRPKNN